MYFPQEPPPRDTGLVRVTDTGVDTASTPTDTGTPTGPTDTGTPTTTVTPGETPCSRYGAFYADLSIHNVGSEPLDLYWRDFACVEWPYGRIEAGATLLQGTYDQQAWVLRGPLGEIVDQMRVNEPYELWEVP